MAKLRYPWPELRAPGLLAETPAWTSAGLVNHIVPMDGQGQVWRIETADAAERLAKVERLDLSHDWVGFGVSKGGPFGLVQTDHRRYILLPGSLMQAPRLRITMPCPAEVQGPPRLQPGGLTPEERWTASQSVTDQAMILAAGLATRFIPVAGDWTGRAKPAVPLTQHLSVLTALARHLHQHGIRRLVVNTFYHPRVLQDQLDRVGELRVTVIEESAPSGTAGGVMKALLAGAVDPNKPLLVVQGDAVTNADFSVLLNQHARHPGAWATIALRQVPDAQVSKVAIVDTTPEGDITRYVEKPSLTEAGASRWGSIGFYVLDPRGFESFQSLGGQVLAELGEYDFAHHLFPVWLSMPVADGEPPRLWGVRLPEPFYWSDIGNAAQYLAAVREVAWGTLRLPQPLTVVDGAVYWPGELPRPGIRLSGNAIVVGQPVGS